MKNNIIEVEKLHKSFKNNVVVKNVTFDVQEGEVFGFLGKNGAGKTTTINMLTGIMYPDSGEFSICGMNSQEIDGIKKVIGVMPDASNFYNDLSALNHLRFFANLKKIKAKDDYLYNLLLKVGLKGHEKKKVGSYSFGMKKKLGIAQAIIGDPKVVFLDEPTSGIDPESILEIQGLIKELSTDGITVFLTSHNLNEVQKICSKIAIMKEGVIAEIGNMHELQNKYQENISLSIRVNALNIEIINDLKISFGEKLIDINYDNDYLSCKVIGEEVIPILIKDLCLKNVYIYEVNINKISLEDIFFKKI
ncbi:ABC transporter ATP-binding protein [Bacillus toyonensis]|uniref:ABC transporter ATP-binding protein n=1 Tax=Bacillus toyonensis TaxID=155322 RepID=UPI00114354C4|nr:ABC transporter ATP-binding protein [Bacillus toyonensis]